MGATAGRRGIRAGAMDLRRARPRSRHRGQQTPRRLKGGAGARLRMGRPAWVCSVPFDLLRRERERSWIWQSHRVGGVHIRSSDAPAVLRATDATLLLELLQGLAEAFVAGPEALAKRGAGHRCGRLAKAVADGLGEVLGRLGCALSHDLEARVIAACETELDRIGAGRSGATSRLAGWPSAHAADRPCGGRRKIRSMGAGGLRQPGRRSPPGGQVDVHLESPVGVLEALAARRGCLHLLTWCILHWYNRATSAKGASNANRGRRHHNRSA